MENVLDLYAEPAEPKRPVVCFDETPVQLIGETRLPWPAKPGSLAKCDYEYRRNGTANLFVFLNAHTPWRHVKVTERKTALDFAQCMHDLAMVHYREAAINGHFSAERRSPRVSGCGVQEVRLTENICVALLNEKTPHF